MSRLPHVPVLALLAALFASATVVAGDTPPTLTTHPMNDAAPGEYVRFRIDGKGGWTRYSVQTVLEVKDGKAWIEEWRTDAEGKAGSGLLWSGWANVPKEIEPLSYQKIVEDEMVPLELGGKKVWCRHLVVNQPAHPPIPEPRVRREVWFSNDVPGWGRVKIVEADDTKTAVSWGTMSKEDLDKAKEARDKREAGERED
jgi:hypothetical protein